MIGDGYKPVSSSERRRPTDKESVKENVDVVVLQRSTCSIYPNFDCQSDPIISVNTFTSCGGPKLTQLMTPSISTPHIPHVVTPRIYDGGASVSSGGDPVIENQLPPNKRAARQATQKWTIRGNNDKLSTLDQVLNLQQQPPSIIVDKNTATPGSGLESHCRTRTLLVLAEATSQFVESSRGDGEMPGFSEVSLSAQKLQEDIKRFIEQHHQKETQQANNNSNRDQITANAESYTSCTPNLLSSQGSSCTMSSKNSNTNTASVCGDERISNTTSFYCAEQRSNMEPPQTIHGFCASNEKVFKSDPSFCAFSTRFCCSAEPSQSNITAPPVIDTHLVTSVSSSSLASSTATSSSLQHLTHRSSSPLDTSNNSKQNASSRPQSGTSDSSPRTPGESGAEAFSSAESDSSTCKKPPIGNFKKKHEFWSHNLAVLEGKNSSNTATITVSSSSAASEVLDLGSDSAVNDCSFNSGTSSGVSTPKESLSPVEAKTCSVTVTTSSSSGGPKYLQRTSRSGTPVERVHEKNAKRREERIRRLSMLLANDDTENKKSRERLKQLRVRFVEEVQRQTEATARSFNIIHSGQFMSSQVWSGCGSSDSMTGADGDEDSENKKMRQQVKCDMMELKKNGYNFFPGLQHLFTYIINQAYHTHHLVSPKWKSFRGINLDVPCKVRLNNLIWRCWHLQFCRRKKHPMCRFVVPSTSPVVPQYGTHLLEGKYWRRQDSAIIAEYMSWRWYYKLKNSTKCKMKSDKLSKICDEKRRLVGLQFPKQHHNLPETYVGGSNADFIQSNLSQFHLVLPVDLLDIEPFQPKTPLNFDFLSDIEKIELDLGETDTASSVSSNFFSPMQPETEISVEAVDSVNTIVSSTDESCLSASNPYEINDCTLSSSVAPTSTQEYSSSQPGTGSVTSVLNANGVLDALDHESINASDVYNHSGVTVGVGDTSPEDHGSLTSSLIHQAFLNPQPHLQDQQNAAAAASALSSDQLLCSSAESAATDAIDPNQLDSDSLTPVFLDSHLNSYSRKRPLSSVDGFDLRSEHHHQQHSLPRYHHGHVYAAASAISSSATVDVVSDCSKVVPVVAATSMHNSSYSTVPPILHKSESISNCCSAAAPPSGYPSLQTSSTVDMQPLPLQRSASVIVSSAAVAVMGGGGVLQQHEQQRQLSHGAFDDEEEEVVEDESDEISESGSDSPNHNLLNSHQHHGQQQMVVNSMVSSSMQKCAPPPVFTSLSNLAPVGVSPDNSMVSDMSNSKNIMSLPHAATPISVAQSQMHGAPNIMPGHLNAMIAAYHPFSPMPNSASIIRGATTSSSSAGAQFLVNGQSTIVSSGSVVPAAYAQQQQSQVSQPNGPTSPLALIMRHQQAVAQQQQHHSLHNQISPHQLQSPSLAGQRFAMGGSGDGSSSSSVSPSEAAVAAATIVQNAPLLKGILGQVGSPGPMSSSGGRQSVSLPLMDKKMMENEEMKANLYDRIDPGVIKYQRLRDKTPEELTLHRERREKVHQISERKRRHNIQVALNNLAEKLPQSGEQNKQFKTRANILSRASSYIESLEDDRDNLRKNILQLREDLAKMNLEIQQLHRILPSDPSLMEERLTEQNCVIMEQQFHAYVTEKSQKEAPFFIFSHLAKRFFESFMGSVKLQNYEKFSESVLLWIQQHCSMVNIRAVVTESLTDLCVKDIPYATNPAVAGLSAATTQQMMSAAQVVAASSEGIPSVVSGNSASACSASSVTLPTSSY